MPGERWVLLRGLTRDRHHWGRFPDRLAAVLPPDSSLVTPDLPGNGVRHHERSPASIAGMTEAYRESLRNAGVRPPYALFAVSMGAMVAVDWAARHPDEVRLVVMVNTSMRPYSSMTRRLRPESWSTVIRLLIGTLDAHQAETAILRLTSNRDTPPQELVDDWARWRNERPIRTANALRQLSAASRFRAPPSPPPCAMLLLASHRDRLVDWRCSLAIAASWGCNLVCHPWAGHDLTLDDADWVAAQVRQWIDERRDDAPADR